MERVHQATWSGTIQWVTWTLAPLLVISGIATMVWAWVYAGRPALAWLILGVDALILAGAYAFSIRGYVVTSRQLEVLRGGWRTMIPWDDLDTIEIDPKAEDGAVKVMGNDGLFARYGWFRSQKLGKYRVYSTDPKHSVILRFRHRTVVVSPNPPERFVDDVEAALSRSFRRGPRVRP